MQGPDAGSVRDLVAAAGSRRRNQGVSPAASYLRKEAVLPDLHADLVMLFFVPEGTGHAAASAVQDGDLVIDR